MGKKLSKLSFLSLSLAAVLGFANCSGTADSTDNQDNNTFDDTFTLFGYVFDATTGARLGDGVEMYLIQGSSQRRPTLNTNAESALYGEYSFEDVPLNYIADNSEYKVIVTLDGYQRFEGYVANPDANDCEQLTTDDFETCNNTLDTYYNLLQDIRLFPLGATAPDLTVVVQYDGERVPGATVYLDPCNSANVVTTSTSSHLMPYYGDTVVSLTGTTDTNGEVVFSGDDLALGACYVPEVVPVSYESVTLARTTGSAVTIGDDNIVQLVSMGDLVPGNEDDGLYVTSMTPLDGDDLVDDGSLTIVFNRAVELLDTTDGIYASLTHADTAALDTDDDSDLGLVTVDLSDDGLTLTLTPVFSNSPVTEPSDADYDDGLQVNYFGVVYLLDDDGYVALDIADDLQYIDGTPLGEFDGAPLDHAITVNMLAPCAGADVSGGIVCAD